MTGQPQAKQLQPFRITVYHSAVLAADTNPPVKFENNWTPEKWIVVARLTAGNIIIYPGADRSLLSFRLVSGTLVLPIGMDNMSIETVGATGIYDLYAVSGLDGFDIKA